MKFAEPKWTMGSALTVKTDPNKHLTGMFIPLKLSDSQGEGKFNLRVETVRPELPLPLFTPTILRENPIPLSSSKRPLKGRDPLPPINKVSPPAMKDRDFHPHLLIQDLGDLQRLCHRIKQRQPRMNRQCLVGQFKPNGMIGSSLKRNPLSKGLGNFKFHFLHEMAPFNYSLNFPYNRPFQYHIQEKSFGYRWIKVKEKRLSFHLQNLYKILYTTSFVVPSWAMNVWIILIFICNYGH